MTKQHVGWRAFAGYDLTFIQYIGYLQDALDELDVSVDTSDYCSVEEIRELVENNHGPSNYYYMQYLGPTKEIESGEFLNWDDVYLSYSITISDINRNRSCKLN